MEAIQTTLETARKELLDLGLRNPLLNYRPLKARGLTIIDEKSTHTFHLLTQENKEMQFLPIPEDPTTEVEPWLQQPLSTETPHRYTDNYLQTPYTSEQLQQRLLTTYYTARSHIEEQGVNILYLTLGMLCWYETDTTTQPRFAPLLLIPVQLKRLSVDKPFYLTYTGTDIGYNLSLQTKLTLDYNLNLPPLPSDTEPDIANYFTQAKQAIQSQPRWAIEDNTITLSFFSFSKFLIYHDLDPTNWPTNHQPQNHPILQALLGPQGFHEPPSPAQDHHNIDDHRPLDQSHLVVDADSSQTLAILDVNHGRNLVIQGPPGTGKSQTITNLIAEALGHGKTILFVAEKMAALEVVHRRLNQVGLGDTCLELHSHKTTKSSFLAELAQTIKLGSPKADPQFPHLDQLQHLRHQLNQYSHILNTPIPPTRYHPIPSLRPRPQPQTTTSPHTSPSTARPTYH